MKNNKKPINIGAGAAVILTTLLAACATPGQQTGSVAAPISASNAQVDNSDSSPDSTFASATANHPQTNQLPELWKKLRSILAQPDPEHPGALESSEVADVEETQLSVSQFTDQGPVIQTEQDKITNDADVTEEIAADQPPQIQDATDNRDTATSSVADNVVVNNTEPVPSTAAAIPEAATVMAVKTIRKSDTSDLWPRIRRGFALPDYDHHRVTVERRWYARHPEYMSRVTRRAKPYLYFIVREIEQNSIPAEIALLPIVESAFQPFAYSNGRAAGIWQFIPSTAEHYGLTQDWWYDGRRDIIASTRAAIAYLQKLHREFDGDWLLALAAYNSGEGTVWKAIRRNRRLHKPTDFWSLHLPRETRSYVPKLLAVSSVVADPEKYHIALEKISDEPYITVVDPGSQIDLSLAADLADISVEELYLLNPGFNRWATHPAKSNGLVLPLNRIARFYSKLSTLPASQRVSWKRHRIRNGETLSHIAVKYHTSVPLIRQVNKLNGNLIRSGRNLLIPVATQQAGNYTLSASQRRLAIQNGQHHSGLKITYIVRSGDSLWTIARKYRVHVSDLARWNGMAKRDVLRPGQRLAVWPNFTARRGTSSRFIARNYDNSNVTQKIRYTVRRGDSLARISKRFNINVDDVVAWNTLDKSKYLQPGQRLTLFVDVTRQAENI